MKNDPKNVRKKYSFRAVKILIVFRWTHTVAHVDFAFSPRSNKFRKKVNICILIIIYLKRYYKKKDLYTFGFGSGMGFISIQNRIHIHILCLYSLCTRKTSKIIFMVLKEMVVLTKQVYLIIFQTFFPQFFSYILCQPNPTNIVPYRTTYMYIIYIIHSVYYIMCTYNSSKDRSYIPYCERLRAPSSEHKNNISI